MIIDVKLNRDVQLTHAQNTQNENEAEKLTLLVPETYSTFNKKIVFITPDGIFWDIMVNNEYYLTQAITKYKQVDFYIWLTKGDVDFRSKTKTLRFYTNEEVSPLTPEEIDGVNTVINLLEEEIAKVNALELVIDGKLTDVNTAITQTNNLNIDVNKVENIATITLTKKDGTSKSVTISDGTEVVPKGEYNGATEYKKLDIVLYNGQSYIALNTTTGNLPTNTTYWQLLVQKPVKGIDYYTAQEKTEMEQDVITNITPTLNQKADKSEIPDVSNFITKDVNDLTYYYTKTEVDGKISAVYKYKGTVLTYSNLPSSGLTIGDVYNVESDGNNYAWTGSTWDKLGGDIDLSNYQTKIDSTHKLSSDLVDDTNNTNKFVTSSEKQTWNGKGTYSKPSGGIPKTDLDSTVQTSLGKADTAIQSHQDISGKEDKTNKVTSLSASSTDTEYPSAKCVYDIVGNINATLEAILGGGN